MGLIRAATAGFRAAVHQYTKNPDRDITLADYQRWELEQPPLIVLSMASGGTKAPMVMYALSFLAKDLKYPFMKYVDIGIGTSTGAFSLTGISGLLQKDGSIRRRDFQKMCKLYEEESPHIFKNTLTQQFKSLLWAPAYDGKGLDQVLDRQIGDVMLSDVQEDIYITVANAETGELQLFSSKMAKKYADRDAPLKQVIRAAIAAPTFFNGCELANGLVNHCLIDGGLGAAHPGGLGQALARLSLHTNRERNPLKPTHEYNRLLTPEEYAQERIRLYGTDKLIVAITAGMGVKQEPMNYQQSTRMGKLMFAPKLYGMTAQFQTSTTNIALDLSPDIEHLILDVNFFDRTRVEGIKKLPDPIHDSMNVTTKKHFETLYRWSEVMLMRNVASFDRLARIMGAREALIQNHEKPKTHLGKALSPQIELIATA